MIQSVHGEMTDRDETHQTVTIKRWGIYKRLESGRDVQARADTGMSSESWQMGVFYCIDITGMKGLI